MKNKVITNLLQNPEHMPSPPSLAGEKRFSFSFSTLLLFTLAICVLTGGIAFAQQESQEEQLPTIFIHRVIPAKAYKGGVPDELVYQLSKIFPSRLYRALRGRYRIIPLSAVKDSLDREDIRAVLDCPSDECVQKVFSAVKTDYLVYGEIGKSAANNYLFTAVLLGRKKNEPHMTVENMVPAELSKKDPGFKKMSDAIEGVANELISKAVPSTAPGNIMKSMALAFTGNTVKGNFPSQEKMSLWYKLPKEKALNRTITLSHESGRDFDIIIYDGDARILAAETGSLTENLDVTVLNSGNCFIQISNYQGQGAFTLSVKDYVDPATIAKWISGDTATGSFPSAAKETHWYKIKKADALDKIFTLSHNQGQDFDVAIYDGKTKVVFGELATNPEVINTKGKFFAGDVALIKITNFQGSGPYTLKIEKFVFAPNAKWFEGTGMTGSFPTTAKEHHWYKLKKSEALGKSVQLKHESGRDFDLYIYDGETKIGSAESNNTPETLKVQNLNSDTCFIQVTNFQGFGPYTLTIVEPGQ